MDQEIRTRIAPSPTGFFHLGTARTALFNYLFSRKNGGKFILRVEDTDRSRSTEEYEHDIFQGLSWLGLEWDEGPETDGGFGPYRQSERGQIYQTYIDKLLAEKKAYYCFCTPDELEKERKEQESRKEPPKYSGKCRDLTPDEIAHFKEEGRTPAIRFRVPENDDPIITFNDLIHGKMEFDSRLISDFVIVKPNKDPLFLLSNVIDDGEMKITHVIRGDDHLSNTPKQILLASALELPIPEYGHLPLILNPDRSKLSKRKNPTSVTHDFKDKGYLPEALINFLAFLGWTPGAKSNTPDKEIFSLKELTAEFDLSQVGRSPAVYDQAKLDYLNGYYLRQLPLGDIAQAAQPFLAQAGLIQPHEKIQEKEKILAALGLVQERMKKLSEAPDLIGFLFRTPKYDPELLITKKSDKERTKKALEEALKALDEEDDFSRDNTEDLLRALADKLNLSSGEILWPLRVALSGRPASPGVFELLEFFGKEESLKRIKTAIDMIK